MNGSSTANALIARQTAFMPIFGEQLRDRFAKGVFALLAKEMRCRAIQMRCHGHAIGVGSVDATISFSRQRWKNALRRE